MYSIKKKQEYTANNLWKDYRITPEEWGEVKAIAGCNTDNVPGVPNVGNSTACKYLNRKLNRSHKTYSAILNSEDLIERNRSLVILPLKGTPEIEIVKQEKLNFKKFIEMSTRYGFQSFINKDSLLQWKDHIFKG
jgi:5'-3' exonuclease